MELQEPTVPKRPHQGKRNLIAHTTTVPMLAKATPLRTSHCPHIVQKCGLERYCFGGAELASRCRLIVSDRVQ